MAKVFVKTFGCSLNQSDSELMAGMLKKQGHELTEEKDAELIVINSCSVKQSAEAKLMKEIKKHQGKKVVVAGCVPQAQPSYLKTKLKDISVIGVNNLTEIDAAVSQTLENNVYQNIQRQKTQRLNLPKVRKNPVIEIVPLNEGCLDNCSYCKTKHARGHLYSYAKEDIVEQAKTAIEDGCKEIWLTSQDTGCYGLDRNTSIVELLKELLNLRGYFKIRLGMMNPNYALQFLDELIEVYQHPKMFKFLHIPVQAGNNRILRLMKRRYTVEAYKTVVAAFKKAIPEITISTDVILGFPTETEEEFMDTYTLVKETKPEVLNISRFWLRPNTEAVHMEQVHGQISKVRSEKMHLLFNDIVAANNRQWLDWEGEILIDDFGTNGFSIGRNDSYKQILIKDVALGDVLNVKITETTRFDLRAQR
ncbi:tRNA (N(6)-L-threonylcarbamoyladenosine(37)-C(2))-methylthiotransferase [Candidatus Woesearchaeota archaeon]|nr:MAG: tRNA (N(6)-L-threonylcarbamoyladenosine(37)-C(2))-methylthiotransferase [Candidatus Woesearchaeota archaeon]